jgi:hypothetical protein
MDAEAAREFLRKYQDMIENLWLENVCYRNLILDSGAIPEAELEQMIREAKNNPENQKIAADLFAPGRKALIEFGLDDAVRLLSSKPPASGKQN